MAALKNGPPGVDKINTNRERTYEDSSGKLPLVWAVTTVKWFYWISIDLLDLEELVDDGEDSHQTRIDVVVLAPLQLLLNWVPNLVQDVHEPGLLWLSI